MFVLHISVTTTILREDPKQICVLWRSQQDNAKAQAIYPRSVIGATRFQSQTIACKINSGHSCTEAIILQILPFRPSATLHQHFVQIPAPIVASV